jgi:hypothetical protein
MYNFYTVSKIPLAQIQLYFQKFQAIDINDFRQVSFLANPGWNFNGRFASYVNTSDVL